MSLLVSGPLTISWRRSLSYRNQSIDLQSKSMGWFLYDKGLRPERVKRVLVPLRLSEQRFDNELVNSMHISKNKWTQSAGNVIAINSLFCLIVFEFWEQPTAICFLSNQWEELLLWNLGLPYIFSKDHTKFIVYCVSQILFIWLDRLILVMHLFRWTSHMITS